MLAKTDTGKLGSFLIVLAVFLISIFGPGLIMGIAQGSEMAGCPFTGGPGSLCQMGVIEHISYWQQLFTATPSNTIIGLAFLLLLLLLSTSLIFFQNDKSISSKPSYKLYNRDNPQITLFNYLLLLFRAGILHPKIY